jgi:hypothetical protein
MPKKLSFQASEPMLTPARRKEICALNTILPHDSKRRRNRDDTLPDYSENSRATGPPTSTWSQQQLLATPGLSNVDVLAYLPSNATLSPDHTTVTVRDKQLVTVPAALASFIMAQASLPPRPILRIEGSEFGYTKFDLKIDMMRYFVRERNEPALNYIKLVDINETASRGESSVSVEPHYDTLIEWAHKFIESPTGNKS